MKALLKSGEWVEIDTAYIFNNQYNTVDGKRIFDQDIKRIVDDVRPGLGRCRYCGAIIKRGEENKHFDEMERRPCSGCFWERERLVSSTRQEPIIEKTTNDNGEVTTRKTVVTTSKYEKYCEYDKEYGGCTNKECRKKGD